MARTKYQIHETVMVNRSQVKEAAYNPRTIDTHAGNKLKSEIQSTGILEPLIWNKRTQNLVGGHQRLSKLDELEGNKEYNLLVAQVDLDDKTEKELNLFLNNPEAQGDWDTDKMMALIKHADMGIDGMIKGGFDFTELQVEFGESMPEFFSLPASETLVAEPMQAPIRTLETLVEFREKEKQARKDLNAKNDAEFYLIVSFPHKEQRAAWMEALGQNIEEKYIDGTAILNQINADAQEAEEVAA